MSKKNALAKIEENKNELMFSVGDNEEALALMSEDSKTYVDDTSADDMAMPRLRILQSGSEECKKSSPKYIEGAEEGDIFNTLSKQVAKGDEGAYFIPVKRRVVYLEWKAKEAGGGLVNNFGENPEAYNSANVGENGKRISPRGHEIVKTYDIFGYVLNPQNGHASEVVISMSKTQAKKAKEWNALIRNLTDRATGNQLPEFAGVYRLTTIPESNDKGSWFNYKIEFKGYTLALPTGKMLYNKAKEFAKMVAENSKETIVSYDHEDTSSSEDRV